MGGVHLVLLSYPKYLLEFSRYRSLREVSKIRIWDADTVERGACPEQVGRGP
jgi:hypothetical protein